jgi:predicted lipid carrier protein YhbT
MIDKINSGFIQDVPENLLKQNTPAKPHAGGDADASLHVDYASLIERAIQNTDTDAAAVERAKRLLLSGELESPLNIRNAAENIVRFGV